MQAHRQTTLKTLTWLRYLWRKSQIVEDTYWRYCYIECLHLLSYYCHMVQKMCDPLQQYLYLNMIHAETTHFNQLHIKKVTEHDFLNSIADYHWFKLFQRYKLNTFTYREETKRIKFDFWTWNFFLISGGNIITSQYLTFLWLFLQQDDTRYPCRPDDRRLGDRCPGSRCRYEG